MLETCHGNWLVATATTLAHFQNATPQIHMPLHVQVLDTVLEKDLAGHVGMTIMTILLHTNAIIHGVILLVMSIVLLCMGTLHYMATAVQKMRLIQMVEFYVLVAVVQVQRSTANLVADHVPQDLHVAGFFQMMCV